MSRIIEMALGFFNHDRQHPIRVIEKPEARKLRQEAEKLWVVNLYRAQNITSHVWRTVVNIDQLIAPDPIDLQLLNPSVALELAKIEVRKGRRETWQKKRLNLLVAGHFADTRFDIFDAFPELPGYLEKTPGAMENYLDGINKAVGEIVRIHLDESPGRQQDYAFRTKLPVHLTIIQFAKAGYTEKP